MAEAVDPAVLGPNSVGGPGGIKGVGDGSGSDSGKAAGGRSSFRQRKLNRLSGGVKRKHEPFEEPLPIGYRHAPNQMYEKLQLPDDALASMWRDYHSESRVLATYTQRPKPPGLFDTVPLSRMPNEPLVQVVRSAESKLRRQRDLMQRDLTVRVARKSLGYCIGREIKEPSPDELAMVNTRIQAVFPDRSLTAAEVKCWCYHERPLIGDTHKFYVDALAAYQRNSNDVIDLLVPEQGRFAHTSAERMAQLRILSKAICNCPFEERDGVLVELMDLQTLKVIWPVDVENLECITVMKGEKNIKLSPLASSIYMANFTQLKNVCKLLSKQSEIGRRVKQPLAMPRPALEEPKRKKQKDEMSMPLNSHLTPAPPLGVQSMHIVAIDGSTRAKVTAALRVLNLEELLRVAKAVGSRLFTASRDEVERAVIDSFFDGIPPPFSQQLQVEQMQSMHAHGAHHPSEPPLLTVTHPDTPTGGPNPFFQVGGGGGGLVTLSQQVPQQHQPPPPPPG